VVAALAASRAAHADLRERELIKSATLVASLWERGMAEATAVLLARVGMMLLQAAYERLKDGAEGSARRRGMQKRRLGRPNGFRVGGETPRSMQAGDVVWSARSPNR
jgi:hypothetical protein